jgi:hypothetical protein
MKYLLSFSLVLFSFLANAQNRGYVYYLDVVAANEDIESIKKYGLNVEILPLLVNVEKIPRLDNLLNDYKSYITTWYSQINSITFLDAYQFDEIDRKNLKIQTLCYVQYKNKDYKWGGCKYFESFEILSDLYFTANVKEYSDRYEMQVIIAEKRVRVFSHPN